MARVTQFVVSGLLATTMANGQSFDPPGRSKDAFSYVQPKDTTILGSYRHSPAVLPSRTFLAALHPLHLAVANQNRSKCYRFRQLGCSLCQSPKIRGQADY